MTVWLVVGSLAVAFFVVHRLGRKAVFERLPIEGGEKVLIDEQGLTERPERWRELFQRRS